MADDESRDVEEVLNQLKKQVGEMEDELDELEESGDADRHPVKHQQAIDKISEIKRQMETIDKAMKKGEKEKEKEED